MAAKPITVENLSKVYRLGMKEDAPDSLLSACQKAATAPLRKWRKLAQLNTFNASSKQKYSKEREQTDLLWALRDVSFEVNPGDVVGIIGRNGAGKSTLLKVLSRITDPTNGKATIRGRMSSLLEVGTGFHPELTGRENIYMNGTILGMTKVEIDKKLEQIIDFSGVEKFLETPVKRYSSGMQVRLAFSVAAHLEPEVLIIDEVLAVGDVGFQKKCIERISRLAEEQRTILFVSHNLKAVRNLCTRAITLSEGQIASDGSVDSGIAAYRESLNTQIPKERTLQHRRSRTCGTAEICNVVLVNEAGDMASAFESGETVCLQVNYQIHGTLAELSTSLIITDLESGERLTSILEQITDRPLGTGVTGSFSLILPQIALRPGDYYMTLRLCSRDQAKNYDILEGNTGLPNLIISDGEASTKTVGYFNVPSTIKTNN